MNNFFSPASTALALRLAMVLVLSISATAQQAPDVTPLRRAHAHNDYEHPRPLLDALDQGFCSIEADIHLIEGELRVAHDAHEVKPGRTLQSLYLDPLRKRVQRNDGWVYESAPAPVILLVDIKSDADATYRALIPVLEEYSEILTRFSGEEIKTNAVTIILSGNRPRAMLESQGVRYAAMDGRPEDLDGKAPVSLIPLVSSNWNRHFKWRGEGSFAPEERELLRNFVQRARSQGRMLRFWASPDKPQVWNELYEAEVDLINTDDLKGLRTFLLRTR